MIIDGAGFSGTGSGIQGVRQPLRESPPQAKSNDSVKIIGMLDCPSVNLPHLKGVFHSNTASTISNVIYGVPQGSILGLCLFIVHLLANHIQSWNEFPLVQWWYSFVCACKGGLSYTNDYIKGLLVKLNVPNYPAAGHFALLNICWSSKSCKSWQMDDLSKF